MAYKIAKFGDHRERATFSKTINNFELADLLDIQKKSYQWFLESGIKEVFDDLFPVESFTGNISLSFSDYCFDEPRYGVKESKERVRTAIKNSGYELFSRKIVVNLAPANIKKEGSIFDLPIF